MRATSMKPCSGPWWRCSEPADDDDFVGDLVAPFVDQRHVDVVHEHRHLLDSWRAVRRPHPLLHVALDGALEVQLRGGAGEVEALAQMQLHTMF